MRFFVSILHNLDRFPDFLFAEDAGEQVKADVKRFGYAAARLNRNNNVWIEGLCCAGHWLKVVAIGISLGFDFDVFHCSVVVSVRGQT